MRLTSFLLLLGAIAVATTACGRKPEPVQPLEHVADNGKLRVKFKSPFAEPRIGTWSDTEAANVHAAMEAERAIVAQLRAAGYDVVEHGKWDVKMSLSVSVRQEKYGDPDYSEATAIFYDHEDRVVDRVSFVMKPGAAPAAEPKRVANVVVNGVVESKKLSSYGEERKAKRRVRKHGTDD